MKKLLALSLLLVCALAAQTTVTFPYNSTNVTRAGQANYTGSNLSSPGTSYTSINQATSLPIVEQSNTGSYSWKGSTGVLEYDTSPLPDNAVITSATWQWAISSKASGFQSSGCKLSLGYYNGPFDQTAYSSTAETSAVTGVDPEVAANWTTPQPMLNIQNISKTGLTAFRAVLSNCSITSGSYKSNRAGIQPRWP